MTLVTTYIRRGSTGRTGKQRISTRAAENGLRAIKVATGDRTTLTLTYAPQRATVSSKFFECLFLSESIIVSPELIVVIPRTTVNANG